MRGPAAHLVREIRALDIIQRKRPRRRVAERLVRPREFTATAPPGTFCKWMDVLIWGL